MLVLWAWSDDLDVIQESNACASFSVNAWICALLTTDRDPASVIPDRKRKSVPTFLFCGRNVFPNYHGGQNDFQPTFFISTQNSDNA